MELKDMKLWDYNKISNIHIIRVLEEEEKDGMVKI